MTRVWSLVAGVALAACADTIAPLPPAALTVAIAGPDTVRPHATVTLIGVANVNTTGAVDDSLLTWWIGPDSVGVGPILTVPMGDTGSVEVTLSVRTPADSAGATHAVHVSRPGSILWRVNLDRRGDFNHDVAIAPTGRMYVGGTFGRLALDPGPNFVWWTSIGSSSGGQPFAVRPDGSVAHNDGGVLVTTPDRDSLWESPAWGPTDLAITSDGGVRLLSGSHFAGLTPGGEQVWLLTSPSFGDWRDLALGEQDRAFVVSRPRRLRVFEQSATPVLDLVLTLPAACPNAEGVIPLPGGSVLIRSTGSASCLSRVDTATGTAAWTWMPAGLSLFHLPAVGGDGALYVALATGGVVKLSSGGAVLWQSETTTSCAPGESAATPALGADGTIFAFADGIVTAVGANGIVRWTAEVEPGASVMECERTPVALTSAGTVIVVRADFVVAAVAAGTSADTSAIWGQWHGAAGRHRRARS